MRNSRTTCVRTQATVRVLESSVSPRTASARYRAVCAKQKMPADTRALGALAERTEGDVRACLNALQMIFNQKAKDGADNKVRIERSIFGVALAWSCREDQKLPI